MQCDVVPWPFREITRFESCLNRVIPIESLLFINEFYFSSYSTYLKAFPSLLVLFLIRPRSSPLTVIPYRIPFVTQEASCSRRFASHARSTFVTMGMTHSPFLLPRLDSLFLTVVPTAVTNAKTWICTILHPYLPLVAPFLLPTSTTLPVAKFRHLCRLHWELPSQTVSRNEAVVLSPLPPHHLLRGPSSPIQRTKVILLSAWKTTHPMTVMVQT